MTSSAEFTPPDEPATGNVGRVEISFAGELDASVSGTVAARLNIEPPPTELVIDLAEVTYLDSAALNVLARAARRCHVVVINPSEIVRRIIAVGGLSELLGVEPEV